MPIHFENPNEKPYYYGRISREEAVAILRSYGCLDGLFLLRDRMKKDTSADNSYYGCYDGSYTLSICSNGEIKHYKLDRQDNKDRSIKIPNGNEFFGPIELIEHYKTVDTGVITRPQIPCTRSHGIEPIKYLFVSVDSLREAIEMQIRSRCSKESEIVDARGRFNYIYEKYALRDLHITQNWYVKNVKNKEQAQRLFEMYGFENGKFLLRSKIFMGFNFYYKLCICYEGKIHNYKILNENGYYYINKHFKFENIIQLIDFYARDNIDKHTLKCKLRVPFWSTAEEPYFCDTNDNYEKFLKFQLPCPSATPSTFFQTPYILFLSRITFNKNANIYKANYKTSNLVGSTNIVIKLLKNKNNTNCILNELQHENIIKTIENIENRENINIYFKKSSNGNAVKSLKGLDNQALLKSLNEFSNTNEVNLINTYSLIILEYCEYGQLNRYLKCNKDQLEQNDLITFAKQIAKALNYLHSKDIIHRNVTSHSIMVSDKNTVKLSGFGLAIKLNTARNTEEEIKAPIKWYSPECLISGVFTKQCDVYSYGVLLWEIFTYGELPFSEYPLKEEDLCNRFKEGLHDGSIKLLKPSNCPDGIYKLIKECCNVNDSNRPSFIEIIAKLENLPRECLTTEL